MRRRRVVPLCPCGQPARRFHDGHCWRFLKTCGDECARQQRIKNSVAARLDWTKDPCRKCGKYPLTFQNQTGYCGRCGKSVIGGRQRKKLIVKAA